MKNWINKQNKQAMKRKVHVNETEDLVESDMDQRWGSTVCQYGIWRYPVSSPIHSSG
jgi:hypothetical protein